MSENKRDKRCAALSLVYESVLKPNSELRQCAHEQKCYHELLEWRQELLEYLDRRRGEEFTYEQ